LPTSIGNVPVDIAEIGKIEPAERCRDYSTQPPRAPIRPIANRQKFIPLLGGASGHFTDAGAGTLGYFVRDKRATLPPPNKPQWYALSCAHVLHPPLASMQHETIQPSSFQDGGRTPQDWVGRESLYTYDEVDAAISQIDIGAVAEIINLPTPVGMAKPDEGMTVAKSGRTTGVTFGTVITDDLEFNFQTWGTSPNPVRFRNVILVERKHGPFACRGDSGSLNPDPQW
jgi:hypothetical protein